MLMRRARLGLLLGTLVVFSTAGSAWAQTLFTLSNLDAVRVRSNNSNGWAGYSLGRTSSEAYLAIAGAPNAWFMGLVAGDAALRSDTGKLALGTNAFTVPTFTVTRSNFVGINEVSPDYPLVVKSPDWGSTIRIGAQSAGMNMIKSDTDLMIMAANTECLRLRADTGCVGIATNPGPGFRLDVNGPTRTCSITITGGCDLAEPFVVAKPKGEEPQAESGMVVVIDPDHPGS